MSLQTYSVKKNRKISLSLDDWKQKSFISIQELKWQEKPLQIWMKGISFPLLAWKQIFKNKDGSEGVLYLVTNDLELTNDQIENIYQKRWNIECFHKTVKQNASLKKSPARAVRTQSNHIFLSILAVVKLQIYSSKEKLNHFAFKAKIYTEALKKAFEELSKIKESVKFCWGA